MFNEIDDILNFNNAPKKTKHKIDDTSAVDALVDTLITKKDTNSTEEKILSFYLTKKLDEDIKAAAKRTGKKLKFITAMQMERLFNENLELVNDYTSPEENVQRSVRLSVDLLQKLDNYVRENDVSKRFVVESLFSDYIRKYK